jgi:Tol biopolymer transport system component
VIRLLGLLLAALLALVGSPTPPSAQAQAATGELLAVVGRQVARVNLALSRPRLVTQVRLPANVVDVAALPGGATAALAITRPTDGGVHAGELFLLDLASGAVSPLLGRADGSESLTGPAWWPDGSGVVFQREDLGGRLVPSAVHEVPHYPSRVEWVNADGTGRAVLADDGRYPGPSPDGTRVAFVRENVRGAALVVWSSGGELELVPMGRFLDLAYPRYSPAGDRIAFLALEGGSAAGPGPVDPLAFLRPSVAEAHGFPWSLWLIDADGANAHRLADPQADDASIAWSPDGTRLFVYGVSGASVVDAASGTLARLPRFVGSGAVAWITD